MVIRFSDYVNSFMHTPQLIVLFSDISLGEETTLLARFSPWIKAPHQSV